MTMIMDSTLECCNERMLVYIAVAKQITYTRDAFARPMSNSSIWMLPVTCRIGWLANVCSNQHKVCNIYTKHNKHNVVAGYPQTPDTFKTKAGYTQSCAG